VTIAAYPLLQPECSANRYPDPPRRLGHSPLGIRHAKTIPHGSCGETAGALHLAYLPNDS
jgi:hypothetical protein